MNMTSEERENVWGMTWERPELLTTDHAVLRDKCYEKRIENRAQSTEIFIVYSYLTYFHIVRLKLFTHSLSMSYVQSRLSIDYYDKTGNKCEKL